MHDRMHMSRRPLPATDPIFEAGNLEREFKAREAAPRVQTCVIADMLSGQRDFAFLP